jgi:HAD superfamily hydrolase (TIGR01484 family)
MTKLLVSDFDNTFYVAEDYLKNIEAANNFVDRGNIFVIATGRHSQKLLKDIKSYNIKYSYLICNDGGIIFDKDLNVIYQQDIPIHLVKPIINIFGNSPHVIDWYIDTGLEITKDKNSTANGLIGRVANLNEATDILNSILLKYPEVYGYISTNWINIIEKTVSKRHAIEVINKIINIDKNDIYTIGDNINDISMSIYNSFCMKNSIDDLKKICLGEYDSVYQLINNIWKGQ